MKLLKKLSTSFTMLCIVSFLFMLDSYGQNPFLSFKDLDATQTTNEIHPKKQLENDGLSSSMLQYEIPGGFVATKTHNETTYQIINISGFNKRKEVGKPALPMRNDIFAIPHNTEPEVIITQEEYIEIGGYNIYPALEDARDTYGAPEPSFSIDKDFYQTDAFYPEKPVLLKDIQYLRGTGMAVIETSPVQYNPAKGILRVYSTLEYQVNYNGSGNFNTVLQESSPHFTKLLKNSVINSEIIPETSTVQRDGLIGPTKNYLIITHDEYAEAADSLAQWKRQMGYGVEIITSNSWTAEMVKDSIKGRYNLWTPKPDYFVIIGDHDGSYAVPGEIHESPDNNTFATDLYYACMDGIDDFIPDMAYGRIAVSSASEAMNVVKKIINYERSPTTNSSFYNTATHCAQFQDEDKDGYSDRRFALNSEEILEYMTNEQAFTINRVYNTDGDVDPTYWNDGSYANGEELPSYLKKPDFAWDGGKEDIKSYTNTGSLYLLHRDHGYEDGSGWHKPQFTSSKISSLSNGDKLPVVFSINCHTGEFQRSSCFAETFIRKSSGGAVGVFAAAYYSYSGWNDAIATGFIDAIWSSPGLEPNWTGYMGNLGPYPSSGHDPFYQMGDVLLQGLTRMRESYGATGNSCIYQHELYHYFGDPAMRIWTTEPTAITASHNASMACGTTSFEITSSSASDGLATLTYNGKLIGKTTLSGGSGIIDCDPVSDASDVILTISKHNRKPYIQNITVSGSCGLQPVADFGVNYVNGCCGSDVLFTDLSINNPTSWDWSFSPSTVTFVSSTNSSSQHPIVEFDYAGTYDVTLIASNTNGADTIQKKQYISLATAKPIGFEDFESASFPEGWTTSSSTKDFVWMLNSGSTDHTTTGPNDDHSASGTQYAYIEGAWDVNTDDYATLTSPCIDLIDVTNPSLSFWYHMYGEDIKSLNVDIYHNGEWTENIWQKSGEQHHDGADPYTEATIDLSAYAGEVIKVRFRGINNGSYNADMAIDDVSFEGTLNSITADFSVDNQSTCSGYLVSLSDETIGGTPTNYTWSFTPSDITYVDGTDANTANPTVQLNSPGEYTVSLSVTDGATSDTQVKSDFITAFTETLPFIDDFQSATTGNPGILQNDWQRSKNGGLEWLVNNNGTTSGSTGPEVDHTLGNSEGIYLFTEASSCASGDTAWLTSTCIDLNGVSSPELSFWYHMHGDGTGDLVIDVFDGSTWANVLTYSGEQQANQTDPWLKDSVDLSTYTGQHVKIRFSAIYGTSYTGDIAIDDIKIENEGCSLPGTPSSLTGANSVCQGSSGISYTVNIANADSYTWSLPPGASIVNGSGTDSITVDYSGSASSGDITVYGTNACGDGALSSAYSVTVNSSAPGDANTITGTSTVCQGQNGVAYSIETVSDASSYVWSLPSGATIANGNDSHSITVNYSSSAASGDIKVKAVNGCGQGAWSPAFSVTVNNLPDDADSINGTTQLCQATSGVSYSTPPIPGATSYSWSLPSGASITNGAGTDTITVNFSDAASSGNIIVKGANSCGEGTGTSHFVDVNASPTISGTVANESCAGCNDGAIDISLSGGSSPFVYNWSNSATTQDISGLSAGNYFVTVNDDAGCSASDTFDVIVSVVYAKINFQETSFTTPTGYHADVGEAFGDRGNGFSYGWDVANNETRTRSGGPDERYNSINHMQNGGTYQWEIAVPDGDYELFIACGDPEYSDQTNDLDVEGTTVTDPDGEDHFDEYNVSVSVSDGRLTISPTGDNAKICFIDIKKNDLSLDISGVVTDASCNGDSDGEIDISVNNGTAPYSYSWNTGETTQDITGLSANDYSITVVDNNGKTDTALFTVSEPENLAKPSNINGTASVCKGATGIGYGVSELDAATSYIWSLPSGASIASGGGTDSIIVNFSDIASSGNITVKGQNDCETSPESDPYAITLSGPPSAAGTISGNDTVCQDQTGVAYSVPDISGASSYSWNLPSGASIASGAGTNSISVNFSGAASSGEISVYGSNTCGDGASNNMTITVNTIPANAGTISGDANVCQGQKDVAYSVSEISGASSYSWNLPSGASIASGAGTNSISVDFSGTASSGEISVYGSNACGDGASNNMTITVNATLTPEIQISADDTMICEDETVTFTASTQNEGGTPSYKWYKNSTLTGEDHSIYVDSDIKDGDQVYCKLTSSILCLDTNHIESNELILSVDSIPNKPIVSDDGSGTLISDIIVNIQWHELTSGEISGADSAVYQPSTEGEYYVIHTNNECNISSDTIQYYITVTGSDQLTANEKIDISIYPNPNNGIFNLHINTDQETLLSIQIEDLLGQQVYQSGVLNINHQFEKSIDISNLPKGTYLLMININQHQHIKRIILR